MGAIPKSPETPDSRSVPALLAVIVAVSVCAHEDDGIASDCLEVVAEGERWHIRNGCDVKVHIAWCGGVMLKAVRVMVGRSAVRPVGRLGTRWGWRLGPW